MVNVTEARKELYKELDSVIAQWKNEQGGLLPIMQRAQEIIGCLDEEVQQYISEKTETPVSTIYGIATFYSLFTLQPRGKYAVGMCLGTACYVRGAQLVYDELVKELGIQNGETTEDGMFSLVATRCIGCCGLAPAMMVGDEVYGRLTPENVKDIIENHRQRG
ncbi:MAG: NAD(P)H-dependent oxidoreductase subunit E [Clostridia bacterium]